MKDHIFSIKLKDNLLLQNMEQNRARLMGKNLPQNCFILTDLLVIGPDRLYCSIRRKQTVMLPNTKLV